MIETFTYPARFVPDKRDGGFVITFRDLSEAISQGDSVERCLLEAADCLAEALAARIRNDEDIPKPSRPRKGELLVAVPPLMAAKAALYLAVRESRLAKQELARRLGCDEKEVRRLLDPRHASKLPRIQAALALLGQQLVVGVQAA